MKFPAREEDFFAEEAEEDSFFAVQARAEVAVQARAEEDSFFAVQARAEVAAREVEAAEKPPRLLEISATKKLFLLNFLSEVSTPD